MRISSRLVYQIVSFSPAAMRVCKFRKHGQKYRIVSWNTVPCEQGGESAALRKALEDNGGQISGCMVLTGAMESGTFFTCPGAPLNVRAQKNALEFELPLHMLQVPQDCVVQFTRFPAEAEGETDRLNVYAFDAVAINHMASFLTMAKVKADEFIYPLLGIRHDDPPVEAAGVVQSAGVAAAGKVEGVLPFAVEVEPLGALQLRARIFISRHHDRILPYDFKILGVVYINYTASGKIPPSGGSGSGKIRHYAPDPAEKQTIPPGSTGGIAKEAEAFRIRRCAETCR